MAADQAAGFRVHEVDASRRQHEALSPCQLIHRAAAAPHPETDTMDQPTAETRAAETPTLTSEETGTRETAEAAALTAPIVRPQVAPKP